MLCFFLIFLTGCGKTYHSMNGKTAGQFEMDKAVCMNFANGAYGNRMPVDNGNGRYSFSGYSQEGGAFSGTVRQQPSYDQQLTNMANSVTNLANTINRDRAFEACLNNLGWYEQR